MIMSPSPENHSLAEKIAVVTGAGSGIGRAVALAKAGAAVACLDIDRTGAEYGWLKYPSWPSADDCRASEGSNSGLSVIRGASCPRAPALGHSRSEDRRGGNRDSVFELALHRPCRA